MVTLLRPGPALLTILALLLPLNGVRGQALVRAAKAGRMEGVSALLSAGVGGEAGAVVDEPDPDGYTALRWAAIRGHGEIVQVLLDHGADPNTVGADGGTSLHGAAHHDDPAMMSALLARGGDVTIRNAWGRTPLHVAARRGCLQVARILLDHGADPDAVTAEGWSTLHVAYRGGHPELAELLLARGADPALADQEGRKPGDVTLARPERIPMSRRQLDDYVGRYGTLNGAGFDVWRVGDDMYLQEFAPDRMIPVAPDTFVTLQEPWRVVFQRSVGEGANPGRVTSLDVAFQRRMVSAPRVLNPAEGFTYVGSGTCKACHGQVNSHHDQAWLTLTTDLARGMAASRGADPAITDPARDQRCVMCHVTAAQNPQARWAEGLRASDDGVGCEACHGPGSAYVNPDVMADREAFLANGGRIPDELTCRHCHRDEAFDFQSREERIRHGGFP